jgi:ribulose-phosphate 3-epimerase
MIEFSMLCLDRLGFKDKMDEIIPLVDSLHCDIMDGKFVDNTAFTPSEINSMGNELPKHVHIMSRDPISFINQIDIAETISFHYEAVENHQEVIEYIKKSGFKAGLVVNPETSIAEVQYLINSLDRVLLMAVHPGFSAQKYIDETSEKISQLRNLSLQIDIAIDGGMNEDTMKEVTSLGADSCVVCSVILKASDHARKVKSLKDSCILGLKDRIRATAS